MLKDYNENWLRINDKYEQNFQSIIIVIVFLSSEFNPCISIQYKLPMYSMLNFFSKLYHCEVIMLIKIIYYNCLKIGLMSPF